MPTEKITMPKLGESVNEGTISTWLVQAGAKVNKYDPIAEVMTDKVNAEVPSSFAGTIKEIVAADGETVAVGELICYIETDNKDIHKGDNPTPVLGEAKASSRTDSNDSHLPMTR